MTDKGMTTEQATMGMLAALSIVAGVLLTTGADDPTAVPIWGPLAIGFGGLNLVAFLVVGALRR
jgi:hypothetical protein